jgi:hypothetical protein
MYPVETGEQNVHGGKKGKRHGQDIVFRRKKPGDI